jgi:ribosomal protein L7/L12
LIYRDSNITIEDASADDIIKVLKALGLTTTEVAYSNYVIEGRVVPQAVVDEMDSLLHQNKKIHAIKQVRTLVRGHDGSYPSLKGAKDFVEAYAEQKNIPHQRLG